MPNEPGFPGEGNPTDPTYTETEDEGLPAALNSIEFDDEERSALLTLRARERTSRPSYDGLRQVLGISHDEHVALLRFLNRL